MFLKKCYRLQRFTRITFVERFILARCINLHGFWAKSASIFLLYRLVRGMELRRCFPDGLQSMVSSEEPLVWWAATRVFAGTRAQARRSWFRFSLADFFFSRSPRDLRSSRKQGSPLSVCFSSRKHRGCISVRRSLSSRFPPFLRFVTACRVRRHDSSARSIGLRGAPPTSSDVRLGEACGAITRSARSRARQLADARRRRASQRSRARAFVF